MWSSDGGGYGDYMKQWREEEAARKKKALEEQAAIDAITDPEERQKRRRQRYKCGDRYIEAASITTWDATAKTLAAQPKGEAAGGGMQRAPSLTTHFGMMGRPAEVITPEDTAARYPINPAFNTKIAIVQGDITKMEVDAVVNAANEGMRGGGGIDGAIHDAAGPLLLEECITHDGCPTGETRMTKGYQLPAKYVLHTVGPMGSGDEALRSSYWTALELIQQHDLRTVAFCCVSTGIFGFPLVRATHIALQTVRQWLETDGNADKVEKFVFCTFQDKERDTYEKLLPAYFPTPELCHGTAPAASPEPLPKPTPPPPRYSGGSMGGGGGIHFA